MNDTIMLKDVCNGGGSYGIAASAVDYSPALPTYLRITDINDNGTLDLNGLKSVDDDKSEKYILRPNDIVFARTGASTGRNYFYNSKHGEFVYAGFLIKFSIDPKKINPIFVKYYCQTDEYFAWIKSFDNGATRGNINAKDLGNMPIPNISCLQQDLLAEILTGFDDKIDLLNRQNKTIEDLAQTYFRQWFVEGKHEEFIAVSDIAILDNEGINPGKKPLELFYHYSIPAFDNAQQPMQELGKAILSNKFKVNPKTILVSKLNPATPRIWIIGNNVLENSVCSTEFQVLKPSDDKYQLFLYFLMKSYNVVSYFSMCTTGTSGSHQRIKPEYILQVEIGKPNEEKLQVYNNIFDDVMLKVQENMKQIQTLQKLRDTLLPKLISGEVQVKM